jgi:hypothetical protein
MSQINNIFSKEYTNTNFEYTPSTGADAADNASFISIILISGAATFTGGSSFKGVASGAINLQTGVALNLGVNNIPLNAFTVTCGAGVFQIVATYPSTN